MTPERLEAIRAQKRNWYYRSRAKKEALIREAINNGTYVVKPKKPRKPLTPDQKEMHLVDAEKYRVRNRAKVRKQALKSYYKRKTEKANG